MPGVVIVGQVPSIPQSAFADSSLCTREPSLPFCIGPAQRGSAVWPSGQRDAGPVPFFALAGCVHLGKEKAPLVAAWRRCHIRGDCEAGGMIQLGAVIGCGGSPSIPQSAFADSSLCTGEPSLPFCIEPAQRGSAVWPSRHATAA